MIDQRRQGEIRDYRLYVWTPYGVMRKRGRPRVRWSGRDKEAPASKRIVNTSNPSAAMIANILRYNLNFTIPVESKAAYNLVRHGEIHTIQKCS